MSQFTKIFTPEEIDYYSKQPSWPYVHIDGNWYRVEKKLKSTGTELLELLAEEAIRRI